MKKQDNEQLCALAQKGDTEARDLLLKNNMGFIRKTANEIYMKSNLAESDLSTETSDLEQEGCLGLLTAIPLFDSSKGIKFLTYAAPFIRNTMTDLIRDVFSQYEQRMTSTTDGLALQKIRLDEILPGEERLMRIEAIADPTVKSPEQIYVDKETMRELYEGLGRLSEREQAYLLYRYVYGRCGAYDDWQCNSFQSAGEPRKSFGRYCDGQPLAGAFVVVLVCRYGGTRAVYTSASFSGQSDFAFQKSCTCVTKSACPTAAEKHLPPHSALLQSTPPTPFPRQPEAKV